MAANERDKSEQESVDKKAADKQAGEEACRCKETSEMGPRELLRLMMNDLAFWKKGKKGR